VNSCEHMSHNSPFHVSLKISLHILSTYFILPYFDTNAPQLQYHILNRLTSQQSNIQLTIRKEKLQWNEGCSSRGSYLIYVELIKYTFNCFLKWPGVGCSLMLKGISFQILRAEYQNTFLAYSRFCLGTGYFCRIVYCILSSGTLGEIFSIDFLYKAC